ncbi:MAG: RnfABCDGE type electron transport complex subunit D [Candidatus Omnitrophica bacterium]|nr:RnfABCDGE type electron transport complex subunit D [Candidatus Omnitrophota bacterium]
MSLLSIKRKLIIFLAGFAFFLSIKEQDAFFLLTLFIALISAITTELVFSCFKHKKFSVSDSPAVSALIIGFVLASDNPWWVIVLASVFAISSKYLIRFNKRHVFNPAAFGIFLSIVLLGANTQWQGTFLWYILLPIGLYFAYKVRKLELLAGYFVTALGLFGAQAVLNRVPITNISGYLSYFYIFIMLIEPKTTPVRPLAKLVFGICAAGLIFIFIQAQVKFDSELAALLILNLSVPLLDKIPERRKA